MGKERPIGLQNEQSTTAVGPVSFDWVHICGYFTARMSVGLKQGMCLLGLVMVVWFSDLHLPIGQARHDSSPVSRGHGHRLGFRVLKTVFEGRWLEDNPNVVLPPPPPGISLMLDIKKVGAPFWSSKVVLDHSTDVPMGSNGDGSCTSTYHSMVLSGNDNSLYYILDSRCSADGIIKNWNVSVRKADLLRGDSSLVSNWWPADSVEGQKVNAAVKIQQSNGKTDEAGKAMAIPHSIALSPWGSIFLTSYSSDEDPNNSWLTDLSSANGSRKSIPIPKRAQSLALDSTNNQLYLAIKNASHACLQTAFLLAGELPKSFVQLAVVKDSPELRFSRRSIAANGNCLFLITKKNEVWSVNHNVGMMTPVANSTTPAFDAVELRSVVATDDGCNVFVSEQSGKVRWIKLSEPCGGAFTSDTVAQLNRSDSSLWALELRQQGDDVRLYVASNKGLLFELQINSNSLHTCYAAPVSEPSNSSEEFFPPFSSSSSPPSSSYAAPVSEPSNSSEEFFPPFSSSSSPPSSSSSSSPPFPSLTPPLSSSSSPPSLNSSVSSPSVSNWTNHKRAGSTSPPGILQQPSCSSPPKPHSRSRSGNPALAAAVSVLSVAAVGLVSALLIVHIYKKRRIGAQPPPAATPFPGDGNEAFATCSLPVLEGAAENFNDRYRIDAGRFADVFWGTIGEKEVVIQKMKSVPHWTRTSCKSMKDRSETLGRIRHQYLSPLIGYCEEGPHQQPQPILVYRSIPGLSLHSRLYEEHKNPGKPYLLNPLTLIERLTIACQIADAVAYLHSQYVIHFNLKTKNVLLRDDNMQVVLLDYSLSIPYKQAYAQGAPGYTYPYVDEEIVAEREFYLAPECKRQCLVTPASDVYAFGVILLELLVTRISEGAIRDLQNGKPLVDIQPGLMGGPGQQLPHGMSSRQVVEKMVAVARQCTEELQGNERPTMSEVASILHSTLDGRMQGNAAYLRISFKPWPVRHRFSSVLLEPRGTASLGRDRPMGLQEKDSGRGVGPGSFGLFPIVVGKKGGVKQGVVMVVWFSVMLLFVQGKHDSPRILRKHRCGGGLRTLMAAVDWATFMPTSSASSSEPAPQSASIMPSNSQPLINSLSNSQPLINNLTLIALGNLSSSNTRIRSVVDLSQNFTSFLADDSCKLTFNSMVLDDSRTVLDYILDLRCSVSSEDIITNWTVSVWKVQRGSDPTNTGLVTYWWPTSEMNRGAYEAGSPGMQMQTSQEDDQSQSMAALDYIDMSKGGNLLLTSQSSKEPGTSWITVLSLPGNSRNSRELYFRAESMAFSLSTGTLYFASGDSKPHLRSAALEDDNPPTEVFPINNLEQDQENTRFIFSRRSISVEGRCLLVIKDRKQVWALSLDDTPAPRPQSRQMWQVAPPVTGSKMLRSVVVTSDGCHAFVIQESPGGIYWIQLSRPCGFASKMEEIAKLSDDIKARLCSLELGEDDNSVNLYVGSDKGLLFELAVSRSVLQTCSSSIPPPPSVEGSSNSRTEDPSRVEAPLSSERNLPSPSRSSSNVGLALGVSVLCIAAVILAIVLVIMHVRKKRRSGFEQLRRGASFAAEENEGLKLYSLRTLEDATEFFSGSYLTDLGGELADVFWGAIEEEAVLIQRMNKFPYWTDNSGLPFIARMETLGSIRHPRLCALIGYCEGEGSQILVYRDIRGCTSLFSPLNEPDKNPGKPYLLHRLTVPERLSIACQIAEGLTHLHEKSILHFNVSSKNIFLHDDTVEAIFADYSLSLPMGKEMLGCNLRGHKYEHRDVDIESTRGVYLAPECKRQSLVTTGSDVYAFGIILLELLVMENATIDLSTLHNLQAGRNLSIQQELLGGHGQELLPDGVSAHQMVQHMLTVARDCTRDANQRPTMSHVASSLRSVYGVDVSVQRPT
ncbi:hypothetical protein CBR_g532 [Chara braunii]|uniref:Protein kinase domain-containing protein n=1 Tax=Chara braunii TaxID=69332 RepID=A0A388KBG0_CHABU|nr:hypothetical protein CBR_g532 [Chara braunii]|eukprot:GBG67395.1 hypothetical protein CBR_g532 [Chara braunii]